MGCNSERRAEHTALNLCKVARQLSMMWIKHEEVDVNHMNVLPMQLAPKRFGRIAELVFGSADHWCLVE